MTPTRTFDFTNYLGVKDGQKALYRSFLVHPLLCRGEKTSKGTQIFTEWKLRKILIGQLQLSQINGSSRFNMKNFGDRKWFITMRLILHI